jgi:murein DD-endopeptidase MepM/ murein hydrolase activator NlpD
MNKIRFLFKKALTPVTIMVIPHENLRSLNIKIPSIGIFSILLLSVLGGFYVFSLAANGLEYPALVEKVDFYAKQFSQWEATVSAFKEVDEDFRRIFSLKSKEKILETISTSYSGSINIQNLMLELQKSIATVDEIKDYLRIQKDIYLATPTGYPVNGKVTSPYGKREDPFSKATSFHSGIDISASPRTPVRATAEGVVSYSGWTPHSGYVVVLEHGFGFSTVYAHNKKNAVKIGHKMKRGDIIGYVGSTGKSTGPHVHYEIWEKGKNVNPQKFLQGSRDVFKG